MIAALAPNNVSMTSSLDCSYSFHYLLFIDVQLKNHCHCHCHYKANLQNFIHAFT